MYNKNMLNKKSIKKSRKYRSKHSIRNRKKSKLRKKSRNKRSIRNIKRRSKSTRKYDYGLLDEIPIEGKPMTNIFSFLSPTEQLNLFTSNPRTLRRDFREYYIHNKEINLSRENSFQYITDEHFRNQINLLTSVSSKILLDLSESDGIVNNENITEIIGLLINNIKVLNLSFNGLINIPESLGRLTNLEKLCIYDSNLIILPLSIGNLVNLKVLELSGINLENIQGIGRLTNLVKLEISGMINFSEVMPNLSKLLHNLINLKELYLIHNQIENIPETIGRLTNLEKLDLRKNRTENIPESIGNLINLKELNLGYNEIVNIPYSVGRLTNLEKLYLLNNQIENIPESIGDLINLKELNLSSNALLSIPLSLNVGRLTKLNTLNLNYNELITDTEEISNITGLDHESDFIFTRRL